MEWSRYIPIDRRQAMARGQDLPDRANGATLFADISGFTPLTELLAEELGPRRGAEELTRQLNAVYDALIATVRFYFSEAERNGHILDELKVYNYGGDWSEEPGPYASGGSGNGQYVEAQGIGDFSPFALDIHPPPGRMVYLPLVLRGYGQPEPTPTPSPTNTPTSTPPLTSTPTPTATPTPASTSTPPIDGAWGGENDQGRPLSFTVVSNGTEISQFKLQVDWGGACGGLSYTSHYFYDIAINGGTFTATQGKNEIAGTFTGATMASGTYKVVLSSPCSATRTGAWTASKK